MGSQTSSQSVLSSVEDTPLSLSNKRSEATLNEKPLPHSGVTSLPAASLSKQPETTTGTEKQLRYDDNGCPVHGKRKGVNECPVQRGEEIDLRNMVKPSNRPGSVVCVFVCLFICLFVCLFVYLSVCLFVSVCLSVCLSVYLSVCLFSCLCLFVCLSVCLSVSVCCKVVVKMSWCSRVRVSSRYLLLGGERLTPLVGEK